MNNGKYTPGPWRVAPCTLEGAGTLRRDIVSDGAEFSPAYVGGDILEDDARLIAAAPDMLEALRAVAPLIGGVLGRMRYSVPADATILPMISAAILKATGGKE